MGFDLLKWGLGTKFILLDLGGCKLPSLNSSIWVWCFKNEVKSWQEGNYVLICCVLKCFLVVTGKFLKAINNRIKSPKSGIFKDFNAETCSLKFVKK